MNLTTTYPEVIEPDMRVDSTFHLMRMDTASSRDSLAFIALVQTHGVHLANEFARGFGWDLSALREWNSRASDLISASR
jgi:hypothetical protein